MGGAIAMALRNKCGVAQKSLQACDIDRVTLTQAQEAGLISKGRTEDDAGEMLTACDLVFLCLRPTALGEFLKKWEHAFKPGALLTDIAGVKGSVVAVAENLRGDIDFIPGHPMAGFEKGGFANAGLVDFGGKNYILCPMARNKPENLQFIGGLIRHMGFGRIIETSAAEHDMKIAFTSQLCHVIAAALIDCEDDASIVRFGGGSFEDFTRIAMLNAPMWTELFISNREALLAKIEQFENSLDGLKTLILGENAAKLEQNLAQVRQRRTEMDNFQKYCTPSP
jgi:prephenate dehydrogenase